MTKHERRLRKLFAKWTPILGLSSWDISIELAPDTAFGVISDSVDVAADCDAVWQYQRATIRFPESYVKDCADGELESHVVHELMHCMLSEMREYKKNRNHEERTAVVLTRAFLKVAA